MSVNKDELLAIVDARHGQPFHVLGPHLDTDSDGCTYAEIRVFRPDADEIFVITSDGSRIAADRIMQEGLFVARVDQRGVKEPYRLELCFPDGHVSVEEDPYRFGSSLSDFDRHLIAEGTHYRAWERMGAHVVTIDGVKGVMFVVWAPNAQRVSVVGDFNNWDGRRHCMRLHEGNGLWEIFIPGVLVGSNYKYELRSKLSELVYLKADPYAFHAEVPPKTASRVFELEGFEWTDQQWMQRRRERDPLKEPMSVYELHLGSWMHDEANRSLSYEQAAEKLADYVSDMGFTHVELMPITEHPFYGSWGYQTTGYFAATSRFGDPFGLMTLINSLHQRGIGVLLDWVPAHFPMDDVGLGNFDGTHLYEHADERQGVHRDWNTYVFNYGRIEVRNFLLTSALFWLDVYHFDGLRVDAVASMLYLDYSRDEGEWIPNEFGGRENLAAVAFIKSLNELVHANYPGAVTIAEESTAWPGVSRPTYLGGLGFTFKWNMGWMHDVLTYMSKDPLFRKYHANELTFSMLYAYTENFVLPFSHDEVVYGKGSMINKMPGDEWQKFANLRTLYGYMFAHPGKKHLFMGMEFAQWDEWNHNDSLQWRLLQSPMHAGMSQWVKDLAHVYKNEPALYRLDHEPGGFRWIDCHDSDNSIYSFIRTSDDETEQIVAVVNFTPVPHHGYRVGVPRPGRWLELLNSDSEIYGGSNVGNGGQVTSEPIPWQNFQHSLSLTIPPLAILLLKLADD